MWLETLCAKKIKIDKKALFEQVCLTEWQSHERSVFQRLECNIRLSVFFNVKNLICLWRPLKFDSSEKKKKNGINVTFISFGYLKVSPRYQQ